MWTNLSAEVAELFEAHAAVDQVLGWAEGNGRGRHDGTVGLAPIHVGLSFEAYVEVYLAGYVGYERVDRWIMGREIAREEAVLGSYFREFTAEVLRRRAAARAAARGSWAEQPGQCSKYGCAEAPVEGRRMCRPHAQQATAAVQRSKARRKTLAR